MSAGDSMQFFIDDESSGWRVPIILVTVTENADGSVTFDIAQLVAAGNYLGDLLGFFADFADESLIGTLSVRDAIKTDADGTSQSVAAIWAAADDSIKSIGTSANNMNGWLGTENSTSDMNNTKGYDFGIAIGTQGIAYDDVRRFTFTLDSGARDLALSDFLNADLGVRLQSIGADTNGDGVIDTSRSDSVKIMEGLTAAETTVIDGNQAPVANPAQATGLEDANSIAITITGTDTDVGDAIESFTVTTLPANGSLFVDAELTIPATSGTLYTASANALTLYFVPHPNFNGTAEFSYIASDGELSSAVVQAVITVTPVNDAPVNTPVTLAAIAEDTPARLITQAELLANASDIDGPPLSATGLAITAGGGSLTYNDNGTWSYTPSPNDDSGVSFSYSVTDGSLSVAGLATLDITPLNDAPIAGDSLAATNAGLPVSGRVTAFDADDGATALNFSLSAAPGSAPIQGSLLINPDGTYTYTPSANASGHDAFTFRVTDPGGLASLATVQVEITGPPARFDVFRINQTLPGVQVETALTESVAALAGGGFVAVWTDYSTGSNAAYGRLFDNQGNPVSAEFEIGAGPGNTFTSNIELASQPVVQALRDGGFAVAWTVRTGSSPINLNPFEGTALQIHNADGSVRVPGFVLDPNTASSLSSPPSLALLEDGTFAVTIIPLVAGVRTLQTQIFDANGTKIGPSINVDTGTVFSDEVGLANGDLAVAWFENLRMRCRILDADSGTLGNEIVLSSSAHSANGSFSIAALEDGGFVVVWHALDRNPDGSIASFFVLGQTYNADGSARSPEFLVTPTTPWIGHEVIGLMDGGFAIAWTTASGTHLQRYSPAGTLIEDTIHADLTAATGFSPGTTGATPGTSIAELETGVILITANGGSNQIDSRADVFGKLVGGEAVTAKVLIGSGNSDAFIGSSLADTLDGRGGKDFLTGLAGADNYIFRAGEANGDIVNDFEGAGTAGGDLLSFLGYAPGASLTNAGGDLWTVSDGHFTETIQLVGVTQLGAGDYVFV